MKRLLVLSLMIFLVSACSSYKALDSVREDLHNYVKEYNDLVRQNEFEKAKLLTNESVREEFDMRAQAARNVKVVDYHILSTDYQTEKGEEIVSVRFDYSTPSGMLKSVVDEQLWSFVYVKSDQRKRWRLMTPLPEFK